MQTRPDKSNVNRSFKCNSLLGPTEPRNLIGEVQLDHFEGGRHHGSGWFLSRIAFMVSTGTHRRQQRQNECWAFGPCGDCGDPSMLCSKALLWERLWRRNVPTLQTPDSVSQLTRTLPGAAILARREKGAPLWRSSQASQISNAWTCAGEKNSLPTTWHFRRKITQKGRKYVMKFVEIPRGKKTFKRCCTIKSAANTPETL